MNLDLPPSSAFAPDPAVARPGALRHPLTLTLPAPAGPIDSGHESMSGSIRADAAPSPTGETLRVAVAPSGEANLTITF